MLFFVLLFVDYLIPHPKRRNYPVNKTPVIKYKSQQQLVGGEWDDAVMEVKMKLELTNWLSLKSWQTSNAGRCQVQG